MSYCLSKILFDPQTKYSSHPIFSILWDPVNYKQGTLSKWPEKNIDNSYSLNVPKYLCHFAMLKAKNATKCVFKYASPSYLSWGPCSSSIAIPGATYFSTWALSQLVKASAFKPRRPRVRIWRSASLLSPDRERFLQGNAKLLRALVIWRRKNRKRVQVFTLRRSLSWAEIGHG